VLFWVGVMLTPVAGAGIWFAHGGGPLRGAALLALLGTVLIGLSVVLRRDAEGTRIELQENLLAEVESLRTELGSAMTTALQRTNHGTHAELAALQEQVDRLAAQVAAPRPDPVAARTSADERRAAPRRGGPPAPRPADPLRDSMAGRGMDPVRDSMGGRGMDPVRDGGVDPLQDGMGGARRAGPPPVDALRDGVSRPDPRAGLRGEAPPDEPRPRRRARHRHRAED
jgi:hypothetical protein